MKRFIMGFCMVLVLFVSIAYGQTDNSATVMKWRQDLQYLATELPRLHKNAFFSISKTAFDQAVAALDSRLGALSEPEIIVEMSKIVALIGDSNTTLNLFQPPLQYHYFPTSLMWLKDGYYITGTPSALQTLLGTKLLKINGVNIETVIAEVSQMIPHENNIRVRDMAPYDLVNAEILQTFHIIQNTSETSFEFQRPDGSTLTQSLKSVVLTEKIDWQTAPDFSLIPQPFYLKHPDRFYWYEVLPDTQDIYFQYNSCREIPQQSFVRFSKDLLTYLDKNPVNRLVIDLRFNGGGNSALLEPVINELKKRPQINQRGHLFVIIGRKTFSEAIINALKLKYETNAILVGEPTGGKPNHFGEVKSFSLPNSGLVVTVSTKFFNDARTDMMTLTPDINAETGPDDYFSGKDPAMQSIISFLNP